MKAKKIKIPQNYLHGRTEGEKHYITNGIYLIDATERFVDLPDAIQLAFHAWERWEKLGKDENYRQSEFSRQEGSEQETPFGPWESLMEQPASIECFPTPFLYGSSGQGTARIFRFSPPEGGAQYLYLSSDYFDTVCQFAPPEELSFYCERDVNTPVQVMHFSQPLGRIAQIKLAEEVIKQGFELGYKKKLKAAI